MRTLILFHFLLLTIELLPAQSTETRSKFTFLPDGHHFAPLRANIQEPRIGVMKFWDVGEMKVDIGNSIDLFELTFHSNMRMTAGIDFMAYAYTTGANGLRLQIDAVDGFFGGNMSFSKKEAENAIEARLRILHHSAHFVDGHALASGGWKDNQAPVAFTRDFGELVGGYHKNTPFGSWRGYGGFSYATLVRPTDIERLSYLAGSELVLDKLIGRIASQPTNIFLAYQLSFNGTPVYAATHSTQVGLKFGNWNEKGPTIYVAYYSGRHMFGEYYDTLLKTVGVGFTVEF